MGIPIECTGFDPHDPDFGRDPWSVFRKLRAECSVSQSDRYEGGFSVLSRYEDVKAAALNPGCYSSAGSLLIPSADVGWLLPIQSDPPLTAAYRSTINHLFNPGAVKELEPLVRTWTAEALGAFVERGSCDFVPELAYPIPGKITMQLMGWPVDEWAEVVGAIKSYTTRGPADPARARAGLEVDRLRERITANVELRRRKPGDDLASSLLMAAAQGRPLTTDEIVGLMMMVIFGGVDTTVAAIGNMLHYLDLDRELRSNLIAEPALLPAAVEELLRYEPPILGFARLPRSASEIRGRQIPADRKILLLWGSANRDEEMFENPDAVQLDRGANPHLTFGVGVHRCQGATLARMELRVVLEEVLARIPDYRIRHDEVVHTHSAGTIYERLSLPATFTPQPSGGRA